MGEIESWTGTRRISWAAVPAPVRDAVEERLGARVTAAERLAGGFSEGVAARLRLADGRDVFVKATADPAVRDFHRREGVIASAFAVGVPSPPLLFALDLDPWVVLVFAFVEAELATEPDRPRVLDAATAMAAALTPAPARPATAPRLGGFADLSRPQVARCSPWAAAHLDDLVELERSQDWAGDTLLHGDLYLFNALVSAQRVWIVDWAHAWVGPAYCDVLTVMAGSGGVPPETLLAGNALTRDLPPPVVDGFLAAHAGFLVRLAVRASDPSLSAAAASLGRASLKWLARRPYSAT
ncbi:hypothetical protein [Dactylosporangium sp. NPDC051541]|uniref:hypothetical protein n=1 Tax=Dactylosporangium sp. NPDC051541 TaxID=3363977 RepID=UPI0037ABA449